MKATWLFRLGSIALLLGVFAWAVSLILDNPSPARQKPAEAPLPLVQVQPSQAASHALRSRVFGTVEAAYRLSVRPQVGGKLAFLHPAFEPGGLIKATEVLFRIEDHDYRLAVQAAEADLARARADVEIEQGRRKVAAAELRLLQKSVQVDQSSRDLALRAPQLRQVRAQVQAAQNAIDQAELELQRTQASLDYDVLVLSRARVAGEVLAAREVIGEVARADRFWVRLQVPPAVLPRLRARTEQQAGTPLQVRANGHAYTAEITRILPQLSEATRLAGALAEVLDPLGNAHPQRPALLLGSYVEADLDAGAIDNSVEVARASLRDGRVWVADAQDRLQVRQAEVVYLAPQKAYLQPLPPGDRVLLDPPQGLPPGTQVRVEEAQP